ncbi:MAG: class I SAM-dependent methyltransferase [Magnetococcales bacterium]|nr:class I SAM-dependent methyltransferase [Magnetococcales bacterium]
MSTQPIYQAVLRIMQRRMSFQEPVTLLDVGAGNGALLAHITAQHPVIANACDYYPEFFTMPAVPVQKVDLNREPLPYPDASFQVVTCSEVIEHLENYRALLREMHRVLKPGGLLIVTTPNILNVKSRLRFFGSGFYNLFGPLPVRNDQLYSTGHHITPISFFHLSHALLDVGFSSIQDATDRVQKYSLVWLLFLAPLLGLGWLFFMHQEQRVYKTLTAENEPLVRRHNRFALLTGRTLLVSAIKP